MKETKKRVGILGGTFDPIHLGHLMMAEEVRDAYHLDKVLFIPAANPPHKQGQSITAARHRFYMTILATASHPDFSVSSLELERTGLSYTVDTVRALLQQYGGRTEFYFIAGADEVQDLPNWHRIEELLTICHFVAVTRPGCQPDVQGIQDRFGLVGKMHLHTLATPKLQISSTDIRQRLKNGHSIRYLVPDAVFQYIAKEGLYR